MNILVTGATGFIGKALIHELVQSSHNIFGLDNKNNGQDLKSFPVKQFFDQDLTQPFHLEIPFDYVFHLGALNVTHVGRAEYPEYHRVNVQGTENLIKAVNTKKFVLMSTAKVYQRQEGVIDEGSPVGPEGDYERSKLEAEELCRRYFDEKDLTIFRAVNIVGPGQAEKAVIPVFFKKALNSEPLEIIYSVHTLLQMLYIGDLARTFILLLEKDRGAGVMNLCSEETIPIGKLAERIVSICRSKSHIYSKSDKEIICSKVTSQKAQDVLGWRARMSVEDILKNYYEFVSGING